jgi:hypothetical protein
MAKSRSESPLRQAKGKRKMPGPGKMPYRISSALTGEDLGEGEMGSLT